MTKGNKFSDLPAQEGWFTTFKYSPQFALTFLDDYTSQAPIGGDL